MKITPNCIGGLIKVTNLLTLTVSSETIATSLLRFYYFCLIVKKWQYISQIDLYVTSCLHSCSPLLNINKYNLYVSRYKHIFNIHIRHLVRIWTIDRHFECKQTAGLIVWFFRRKKELIIQVRFNTIIRIVETVMFAPISMKLPDTRRVDHCFYRRNFYFGVTAVENN